MSMSGALAASQTKSFACLRIFGFGLDFEGISQVLGIQPSQKHRAGELGALKKPQVSDLWLLDTPLSDTDALDAHLRWLRRTLAPHYGFLHALKKTAQVRSYCGF